MGTGLTGYVEIECSCSTCQNMCKVRPCSGTPGDMKKLIDYGYDKYLMLTKVANKDMSKVVYHLTPAIRGHEKEKVGGWTQGPCVFFDGTLCELHAKGLKPLEGRIAIHGEIPGDEFYEAQARLWDSPEGSEVIALVPIRDS